jgi:hypothetical protein
MPKKVITRTGQPGATPADRRILADVAVVTPSPTTQEDGTLLNRNEFLHLLFKVQGTIPVFRIQVWWYSFISGMWHRGEVLTVNNDDLVTIEVQGLNRIYLEVENITGVLPVLDAWLALVVAV